MDQAMQGGEALASIAFTEFSSHIIEPASQGYIHPWGNMSKCLVQPLVNSSCQNNYPGCNEGPLAKIGFIYQDNVK